LKSARIFLVWIICLLVLLFSSTRLNAGPQRVISPLNKHNLSISGPGPVKATSEQQICVFCHTPHNASPKQPLWSHSLSSATYTYYWSPTLNAYAAGNAPPVDGASKLCLGCHDGTVAIGAIRNRPSNIQMQAGACLTADFRLTGGAACGYVGTDLSGGHPISFLYSDSIAQGETNLVVSPNDPDCALNIPCVRLDGQGKVQCTACHDPHDDSRSTDVPPLPFWNKPTHDEVCDVCHTI